MVPSAQTQNLWKVCNILTMRTWDTICTGWSQKNKHKNKIKDIPLLDEMRDPAILFSALGSSFVTMSACWCHHPYSPVSLIPHVMCVQIPFNYPKLFPWIIHVVPKTWERDFCINYFRESRRSVLYSLDSVSTSPIRVIFQKPRYCLARVFQPTSRGKRMDQERAM